MLSHVLNNILPVINNHVIFLHTSVAPVLDPKEDVRITVQHSASHSMEEQLHKTRMFSSGSEQVYRKECGRGVWSIKLARTKGTRKRTISTETRVPHVRYELSLEKKSDVHVN